MRIPLLCAVLPVYVLAAASCSLNYGNADISENNIPEIISTNAQFSRTENGAVTLRAAAGRIEQYKDLHKSYAKDISFSTYNGSGEIDSDGVCSVVEADSDKNEYIMLNNIFIQNYSRKLKITAENLHWNGNSEQLTGGKNEKLLIERDDVSLEGTGFSASAVSNTFKFSDSITGNITTKGSGTAQKTAEASEQ